MMMKKSSNRIVIFNVFIFCFVTSMYGQKAYRRVMPWELSIDTQFVIGKEKVVNGVNGVYDSIIKIDTDSFIINQNIHVFKTKVVDGFHTEAFQQNLQQGKWIAYFRLDTTQIAACITVTVKKVQAIFYFRNGNIRQIISFKEGKREGMYYYFYPNGNLRDAAKYSNDSLGGIAYFYYDTGELHGKGNYEHGKRNGKHEVYYISGKVEESATYKDGNEDGEYISYKEDGKIQNKWFYKDGKRIKIR
jgi:antitoxin component YwqK of YwqJK toxin-antitoxin module